MLRDHRDPRPGCAPVDDLAIARHVGAPPLRVSPYAMNENRVTPADAASAGSGVAGGSIGRTAAQAGADAGAAGC